MPVNKTSSFLNVPGLAFPATSSLTQNNFSKQIVAIRLKWVMEYSPELNRSTFPSKIFSALLNDSKVHAPPQKVG